ASALVTAMQAGEIDLLYYIGAAPAGDLDQLKPNSNITIIGQPGHGFQEFRLYRGRPPFDNTDLVDAFGFAIDRKAMLAGIYGNVGQVAGGPVNPASWAWDPNFKGFALDDAERDAQV